MKISIITPIYNEEKNIDRYFQAIKNIEYPKENFEIIIVNDGSTDNSQKVLENIQKNSDIEINIINLTKNSERNIARETGAKKAKHENLLFIDCKCEIFPDALSKIKEINYAAIIGNPIQKNDHLFDHFFLLLRTKLYKKSFQKFNDIYINKENFAKTSKGTTIFFCKKDLFLKSQAEDKANKYSHDDTKLFWNIIKKQEILKTEKVKCYYNTRKGFKENIKHVFNRGPKFINYYYKTSKKEFWIINLSIIATIAIIYGLISTNYQLEILTTLLILNSITSLYLSKNIKDFLISFALFPIIAISFLAGLVKGIIVNLAYNT